ncbi:hypothetical protein NY547_02545 [Cnuibacter physcomitrellae]|nr:hypothetical protein [Cnuibacter physcomitrellae]
MALITRPIKIEDGAWVTSRCIVLGGVTVGTSAVVGPGTVLRSDVEPNSVVGSPPVVKLGRRFRQENSSAD